MNEATVKLLEQLAAKLGTTVQFLWGAAQRQAVIDAWVGVVLTVVPWLVLLGVVYFTRRVFKSEHRKAVNYILAGVTISVVSLLVAVIATFCYFGDIVGGFTNPDWAAFRMIRRSI